METPSRSPVMILRDVVFFPGTLLPLHIFEPRYKEALNDALEGDRMFTIAMRRANADHEAAERVAGLGLIRASVENPNGTSNMILEGVRRVYLSRTISTHSYPYFELREVPATDASTPRATALVARARELAIKLLTSGASTPPALLSGGKSGLSKATIVDQASQNILDHIKGIMDPERAADYIASSLLSSAEERQDILNRVDFESRVEALNRYLSNEWARQD